MIIGKRILNLQKYTGQLKENDQFYIALDQYDDLTKQVQEVGFSSQMQPGETVLPKPKGPVSGLNANGGFTRLKDLPKETVYRERYWEWEDWGGNHHSKIVYIPYERYQRQDIPAPSEELTLASFRDTPFIISRKLIFKPDQHGKILHIINLFLELFGRCRIFQEDRIDNDKPAAIRLNWQLLPPGEHPWERFQSTMQHATGKLSENKKAIISNRAETIEKYGPEFFAYGSAGFSGYFVYGFPSKGLYLLESVHLGNATYAFNKDWEALSRLTKAEIINGNLHQHRLVHKEGWPLKIQKLLN